MTEFKQTHQAAQTTEPIRRRYFACLLLVLIALPFVLHGARQAIDGMRITPEKWVSLQDPHRQRFETFRRTFEGNDVVLLSWEGCTIEDPRLEQFRADLLSPDEVELAAINRRDYERVETGASALKRLTEDPLNLGREQAVDRLQGLLVGPDRHTSCALVVLTYEGNERRAASIDRLKQIALQSTGLSSTDQLRVAGPPHDGVAIDRESVRGVNVFSTLCTLVSAVLCVIALRSWRMTAVILGIACLGQGIALSLVYYSGLTLDAILIVIPPLVFVLTVSAGVHLVNYYSKESLHSDGRRIVVALRKGWKPCLLAAVTTAIGLGSLVVSRVMPVTVFGVIAAVSLLTTTLILLALLPGELLFRPLQVSDRKSVHFLHHDAIASSVVRHHTLVILICLAAMIAGGAGVSRLSTSVDALSLFPSHSPIAEDYRWFESNIGAVVPVEVVVEIPGDHSLGWRQRVELIDELHQNVQRVEGVNGVVSPITFAPELPGSESRSSLFRSRLLFSRMEKNRDDFIEQNLLSEDSARQSWRITGRVSALAGPDYAALQDRLRKAVSPVLASQPRYDGIRVTYTGMMPLIQRIQTAILEDLVRSFLTAFALVAISIACVLRNLRLTVLAMLPNLFPVALIFGGMGWLDIPVDIGTVMTASVALGIAVDDTIHFLSSYRSQLAAGDSPKQAVCHAIQKCSRAMLQTTVICAAGMLVFCFSAFVPTFRFGLVMALSLSAALIGDLIFLPALLVSPLGHKIAVSAKGPSVDGESSVPELKETKATP